MIIVTEKGILSLSRGQVRISESKVGEALMAGIVATGKPMLQTKRGRAGARPLGTVTPGQNCTLSENWICRAEPKSPVGKRVLLIAPKVVLVGVNVSNGFPKFG